MKRFLTFLYLGIWSPRNWCQTCLLCFQLVTNHVSFLKEPSSRDCPPIFALTCSGTISPIPSLSPLKQMKYIKAESPLLMFTPFPAPQRTSSPSYPSCRASYFISFSLFTRFTEFMEIPHRFWCFSISVSCSTLFFYLVRSQVAYSGRFLSHLPLVLLGLRSVPKEDTGFSISESVYGPALTIPGVLEWSWAAKFSVSQ